MVLKMVLCLLWIALAVDEVLHGGQIFCQQCKHFFSVT
jgi:hypothetical protein